MMMHVQITSDEVLDSAYEWMCRRLRTIRPTPTYGNFAATGRAKSSGSRVNSNVGNYRFSLLSRITLKDGEDTDLWSARDALVLKALAIVLGKSHPNRNIYK